MTAPSDPHAVTTLEQLEALYATPSALVLGKVATRLDGPTRAFLAASPFLLLGTSGPQGLHVTPRGDAAGFVEALDDATLILPDRRGNNRLDALRDILVDPRVALLFLVPGAGETLRIHGEATITTDPALCARHVAQGKAPISLLRVRITSLYMQCAKAVMRSRLWNGHARPPGLPTLGELLAAHSAGNFGGPALDAQMPEIYARTIY